MLHFFLLHLIEMKLNIIKHRNFHKISLKLQIIICVTQKKKQKKN